MRGVQIGEVRDVNLFFTGRGHQVQIMAVIDVRRGAVKTLGGRQLTSALSDAEVVRQQVAEGLRAELRSSSPIAGQKTIDLDFHPERPARFSGLEAPFPEVPTAPTGMEMLNEQLEATLKRISEVPVDEVVSQLTATLASAQSLLDSGDVRGAARNLNRTLAVANRTLEKARETMGGVDRLSSDLREAATTTDETMMQRTLATVERNVERTADTQLEAARSLEEMRELMKSARFLVETLQQHPESLIVGKKHPEEKD
jgi:paraquat-inducible protein B